MNKASKKVEYLLDKYTSPEAIAQLTGNGFLVNLMQNFGKGFNRYLYQHYQVRILSYGLVKQELMLPDDYHYNADDLCVCNVDGHQFRLVRERDAGTIQSLIKKWYQCSDELNLRLVLLFHSKFGSKFLAQKSGVPETLISKARHGHIKINQLSVEHRLALENVYMNSHIAEHIRKLHIVLKV